MNIDKDIERCKELIKTEHSNWIGMSNQDAIENVLLRLEEWEKVHNLINESAVRIDNTPTTSTLEVDLNKLFTHIGFLDNETLVNIKLKNTTRYKVDLDADKSELETYKKANDNLLVKNAELKQDVQDFQQALNDENLRCSFYAIENNDLKEKLEIQGNITETYKKIAEKLAYYTQDTKKLIKDCVGWGCTKGIECTDCIIDWARKEVENEICND